MEVSRHALLDRPYQGNGIWIFVGIFSIFLLFRVLLGARQKRKSGQPVDVRTVIAICLFFVVFCAVALFQLLSHCGREWFLWWRRVL
jgi:hypothetical protein